jgi:GH25 family lysozyme M1 (1,4-beta-N-acetylmuramidase)
MALVPAIDVSDNQPRDVGPLVRAHGAKHVVVKLYLLAEGGESARQFTLDQAASAKAAGASVGGYVWGYSSEGPGETADQAAALYSQAGMVGPVYLDMEEYRYRDGHVEPPLTVAWIRIFVLRMLALGHQVEGGPGFYSRKQYIRDIFPGGEEAYAEFGSYPLWLADYDDVPLLDCALPQGCTNLVGKQYARFPIDLDVFDPSACGGIVMPPVPSPLELADLDEQDQFDPANYDTRAEYAVIAAAACSAAALAAVATDNGIPMNITQALRAIRATGDDVTPELGLLNRLGQAESLQLALDDLGIASSTHAWDDFDRETFKEVLESGRPIIVQMKNYLGRGLGHFLVVDGLQGDGTVGVRVADSNAGTGKRFSYTWDALWREMAGGTAVWADQPRGAGPVVPPEDEMSDAELLAENARLKDRISRLEGERDGLLTRMAYVGDDVGDALQAAVNTLRKQREEGVGPRPAGAA